MKKKGFTLIELLAVIVILAIIALIATPLVLKYIEKSRKESKVDSAYSFVRNLETEIANYSIKNNGKKYNGQPSDKGYYELESFNSSEIDTTVKGDKPNSIKVCLSSLGQVEKAMFEYGKYYVSYDGKKGSISDEDTFNNFNCNTSDSQSIIGKPIFFDVDKGDVCDYYTESQSAIGVKNGCMRFYVLNDSGETLDLILDHNTTASIEWNNTNKTSKGPVTLMSQLYEDTKNWEGTLSNENYIQYNSSQSDIIEYEINYTNYKARLITLDEILNKISFYTNLNDNDKENWKDLYYDAYDNAMIEIEKKVNGKFNDNDVVAIYKFMAEEISQTDIGLPSYLSINILDTWSISDDYTDLTIPTEGYWTASSHSDDPFSIYLVNYMAAIGSEDSNYNKIGIRPVIKVSSDVFK